MTKRALHLGMTIGLIGGTVMAAFAMAALGLIGKGFWTPVNLFANTFWSGAPTDGTFNLTAALLGVAVHLTVSIIVGTLIAVLVERGSLDAGAIFMVAAGVGTCAWIGQGIFWPMIDAEAHSAFTPWALAVAHAVFAVTTALALQAAERKARADKPDAVLASA